MFWNSQNIIFGQAFVDTIIAAWKTAATVALILAASKVRLSKSNAFAPTSQSTIASLSAGEADYTGYTAGGVAVALSGPVTLSTQCQGLISPASFIATTSGSFQANQVYGYWVDDGTNVIVAEKFPAGTVASFDAAGAFLSLNVAIPMQLLQATL